MIKPSLEANSKDFKLPEVKKTPVDRQEKGTEKAIVAAVEPPSINNEIRNKITKMSEEQFLAQIPHQ